METQMFPTDNSDSKKPYWQRPGGKFGLIFGAGLAAIVGYYVVPILTQIVWNTLHFGIALACLGVFLFLVTNRKLRLTLLYGYELIMKKLIGLIIELDPFIIAESYIKDMEQERENLYQQSVQVDGQKESLQMQIIAKENERAKLVDKAKAAKANNMLPELGNATRQIARLDEYIKQLSPIRDSLSKVGDYLTKVHKNSAYLIEDAKNELGLKKDLYKSVTKGNQALNSALKIFKGDPEKKLMVEQSMEYLKDDIALKLASMKKAISYSSDFMKSIDLDNATFEVKGLQLLEDFDSEKELRLKISTPEKVPTYMPGKVNKGEYDNLLE